MAEIDITKAFKELNLQLDSFEADVINLINDRLRVFEKAVGTSIKSISIELANSTEPGDAFNIYIV